MQIVEITIDPERDTVRQLDAYRGVAQLELPNWTLLTAAPADLARLWKFFGVDVEKTAPAPGAVNWLGGAPLTYDLTHTDEVFFLDKRGHERFLIDGAPNTKGVLPSPVLDQFLNEEGQANLTAPDASTWTADDATASLAWVLGKHLKAP